MEGESSSCLGYRILMCKLNEGSGGSQFFTETPNMFLSIRDSRTKESNS